MSLNKVITSWKFTLFVLLFVLELSSRNINSYRFMSEYEYQMGLVDIIDEAAPEDEITKECYNGGQNYLANLTDSQKYRMCREAITLERFVINNFTVIKNGMPGAVKKYKSSFQITHIEGDMLHLISMGFLCPSDPGPVCLQQGPLREVIYVNSLKTIATTPGYEF